MGSLMRCNWSKTWEDDVWVAEPQGLPKTRSEPNTIIPLDNGLPCRREHQDKLAFLFFLSSAFNILFRYTTLHTH